MALTDLEGLVAMTRLEHRVAAGLENISRKLPDGPLVLHQQNRLMALGRVSQRAARLRRVGGAVDARQVDFERRALTELAVDPDWDTALLHDPLDGRPVQPRPLARPLGGEEGLEEPRPGVRAPDGSSSVYSEHGR